MSENIHLKLANIQSQIKAPKSEYNEFGKFNYRTAEDILAAAKPLLKEHNLVITLRDDIELIGDRFYVRSIVRISDGTSAIETSSYAREPQEKKGMDSSQITGSTSSYARKYALAGIFGLDDEADADADITEKQEKLNPDRFTKAPKRDLGGYVINYGKENKGKTFNEAGKDEVKKLLNWFLDKQKEKPLAKDHVDFVNHAREFLRQEA